jgi:hypothetical protein
VSESCNWIFLKSFCSREQYQHPLHTTDDIASSAELLKTIRAPRRELPPLVQHIVNSLDKSGKLAEKNNLRNFYMNAKLVALVSEKNFSSRTKSFSLFQGVL